MSKGKKQSAEPVLSMEDLKALREQERLHREKEKEERLAQKLKEREELRRKFEEEKEKRKREKALVRFKFQFIVAESVGVQEFIPPKSISLLKQVIAKTMVPCVASVPNKTTNVLMSEEED